MSTIDELLKAFCRQEWDDKWEILFSDNGKNENLGKIIDNYRGELPKVAILDSTEKSGPAYARNNGAAHAHGKYLVFVDADDVVGRDWLKNIGRALQSHDFVASRRELVKLNSDRVLWPEARSKYSDLIEFEIVRYLPYVASTGLGVRKDIHDLIGGFDEDLKAAEDLDYCWRVQMAGYDLHVAEGAILHYRLRDSLWACFKQMMMWGEFDVLIYKKYRSLPDFPKQKKKKAIKEMLKLIKAVVRLHRSDVRSTWVRLVAKRVGRLKGSIKHRVLVL